MSLFLLDLVIPDFIPFLDELLLGGMTALIGLWKRDSTASAAPRSTTGGREAADEKRHARTLKSAILR